MPVRHLSIIAALVLAGCAPAPAPSDISIVDAWARATAPGQSNGAVYASIRNAGGADTLVGVSTDVGTAMLHAADSSGGMARMRMVGSVDVPARGEVRLAPGGTHVMLTGLKRPLVAGEKFSLQFGFATAGPRAVEVAVVAPGSR